MNVTPLFTSFSFSGTQHMVYHPVVGEGLPKHEHTYPHITICHAGELIVRKEGKEVRITPETGAVLLVADQWHELEAAVEGTVFENVFSTGQLATATRYY